MITKALHFGEQNGEIELPPSVKTLARYGVCKTEARAGLCQSAAGKYSQAATSSTQWMQQQVCK
jgi:hypothetical protein